jgi:ADP-ribose pyrophosphatase YjhB (NUDIX family)
MRLNDVEFFEIYSKVPRLCVDLCIFHAGCILMMKRDIEPNLGKWHLPGGTVYKGETLEEAAKRIALGECGFSVVPIGCLGAMQFLEELRSGVKIHTVSVIYLCEVVLKEAPNFLGEFLEMDVIPEHAAFLSSRYGPRRVWSVNKKG